MRSPRLIIQTNLTWVCPNRSTSAKHFQYCIHMHACTYIFTTSIKNVFLGAFPTWNRFYGPPFSRLVYLNSRVFLWLILDAILRARVTFNRTALPETEKRSLVNNWQQRQQTLKLSWKNSATSNCQHHMIRHSMQTRKITKVFWFSYLARHKGDKMAEAITCVIIVVRFTSNPGNILYTLFYYVITRFGKNRLSCFVWSRLANIEQFCQTGMFGFFFQTFN